MSVSGDVLVVHVVQAYRFALNPTPSQVAMLLSHCGAQRFAFNWALDLVSVNLRQRAAERSYGIAESELTPAVGWSAYELRKRWNQVKGEVAPWWRENSKEAYSSGIANLSTALTNWSSSRAGNAVAHVSAFRDSKVGEPAHRVDSPPGRWGWPPLTDAT